MTVESADERLHRHEARAIDLIVNERVTELEDARVFTVRSNTDRDRTYLVAITSTGRRVCSCRAGERGRACCHATAADLVLQLEQQQGWAA